MAAGLGSPPGGGSAGPKRVVRTGLALVHANEIVYPAAGSEAMAERAVEDGQADIEVHFPIVIEVSGVGGAAAEVAAEGAAADALRRAARSLRS